MRTASSAVRQALSAPVSHQAVARTTRSRALADQDVDRSSRIVRHRPVQPTHERASALPDLRPAGQRGARRTRSRLGVPQRGVPGVRAAGRGRRAGPGGRRVTRRVVLALAALAVLAPPARAADPGRWRLTGVNRVPLEYYQGMTSDPARRLWFDGVFAG